MNNTLSTTAHAERFAHSNTRTLILSRTFCVAQDRAQAQGRMAEALCLKQSVCIKRKSSVVTAMHIHRLPEWKHSRTTRTPSSTTLVGYFRSGYNIEFWFGNKSTSNFKPAPNRRRREPRGLASTSFNRSLIPPLVRRVPTWSFLLSNFLEYGPGEQHVINHGKCAMSL